MSRFPSFSPPESGSTAIIITTALATIAAVTISRFVFEEKKVKIIKSPVATLLPRLSQAEKDALPYPPDSYPGARDVDSPYGSIRVYEWGPEDGRKVLLVHGITTSCLAVGPVAHKLVEKGCRVMLFDLWGRGYSDNCADLPHDERLYSTQILLAITSSPLPWTGASGFSLIGYSLGGGISAAFASYFPNLVNSLVLLVPTGLIRKEREAQKGTFLFISRLVPNVLLERYVKRRLQTPLFPKENSEQSSLEKTAEPVTDAETEISDIPKPGVFPVSLKYPNVEVVPAVMWQVGVHEGFFSAFISTVEHAPVAKQHELWKRLRNLRTKVLIFAASHDPIINAMELEEDVAPILGDRFEWILLDGAHDITNTHPDKIADGIFEFWGPK